MGLMGVTWLTSLAEGTWLTGGHHWWGGHGRWGKHGWQGYTTDGRDVADRRPWLTGGHG